MNKNIETNAKKVLKKHEGWSFFLCTVMLISCGSFFCMALVKMMFVDPFEDQGKSHFL